MNYILGIDVGTTGTKAILFRQDGVQIGQAYRAYPMYTPQPGCCEQDPADWWDSVCGVVKAVTDDPSIRSRIVAMALSTQGGTMVGIDENGRTVRPAMVWNDRRCARERKQLREDLPEVDVYRVCGWHPSDAMPALQCRWLRKHEPENFKRIHRFLSVPDYLSWRMTGNAVIDISNAGICSFADIRSGRYHPQLTAYAGLRPEQLASIVLSGVPIGTLTDRACEAMNLPKGVMLISGAHDQYAVAMGAGACSEGDILIGSGTCWVVTSLSGGASFDTGLSQSVSAVPGLWGSLRSLPSGGVCLEWLRKIIGDLSYEEINREVSRRQAATEGLYFFPFDAKTGKGGFSGLELRHDKFHLARAIMEGVAFQAVWMMESFRSKPSAEGLKLAGGAARSEFWCQLMADIAGVPVRIPEVVDLACVGAAILAGTGSGIYSDVRQGYQRLAVKERVIKPDPERSQLYRQLLAQYKVCAQGLQNTYDA